MALLLAESIFLRVGALAFQLTAHTVGSAQQTCGMYTSTEFDFQATPSVHSTHKLCDFSVVCRDLEALLSLSASSVDDQAARSSPSDSSLGLAIGSTSTPGARRNAAAIKTREMAGCNVQGGYSRTNVDSAHSGARNCTLADWMHKLQQWPHLVLQTCEQHGVRVNFIQAAISTGRLQLAACMLRVFPKTCCSARILNCCFSALATCKCQVCLTPDMDVNCWPQDKAQVAETTQLNIQELPVLTDHATVGVRAVYHDVCTWCSCQEDLLQQLVQCGACVNAPDTLSGDLALSSAARQGNWKAVRAFCAAGADPRKFDRCGWTPLHHAVGPAALRSDGFKHPGDRSQQQTCLELIRSGADIEAKSNFQRNTPLLTAAWSANPTMIEFLLAQGADPTAVNDRGSGVLHNVVSYDPRAAQHFFESFHAQSTSHLCRHGHFACTCAQFVPSTEEDMVECVQVVCRSASAQLHNESRGSQGSEDSPFAVHVHTHDRKKRAARTAVVSTPNKQGTTPLLWAARACRPKLVRTLCEAGADVNSADLKGTSALHAVAGAEPSCYTHNSSVPADSPSWTLDTSSFDASCIAIITTLLEHGARINQTSHGNRITPLMNAAASGNVAAATALLKHGADPSCVSSGRSTALHFCCSRPRPDSTTQEHTNQRGQKVGSHDSDESHLLQSTSSFSSTSQLRGRTHDGNDAGPPQLAKASILDRNKARIAQALLAQPHAMPNSVDVNGFTAALMAAWSGLPQLLDTLLAHPAVDNNAAVQGWRLAHVVGMKEAAGSDADLAACVYVIGRHVTLRAGGEKTGSLLTSCWRRLLQPPSPRHDLFNATVPTATGKRSPLSLAAECGRHRTAQALLDCGARDVAHDDILGRSCALHFATIGKRAEDRPCGDNGHIPTAAVLRHSSLSEDELRSPFVRSMVASWPVASSSDQARLKETIVLFMRRGCDVFQPIKCCWPAAGGLCVPKTLRWSVFDYLVAGEMYACLQAIHQEHSWTRRQLIIKHRRCTRAK